MTKPIKRLLILIILLIAAIQSPPARAEGGLAVRPYWTFRTDAPVTHVQTGDINGDGVQEVVLLTADNVVHVVENDGTLAWRYEIGDETLELLVADVDGDNRAAEIFVRSALQRILFSDVERPVWTKVNDNALSKAVAIASDIDGDGRPEILQGLSAEQIQLIRGDTGELPFGEFVVGTGRPINAIWTGDVDGDGQPEIVPSPVGASTVVVYKNNFDIAWQYQLNSQIALVRGGDVDGDRQAEIVVLTTSGNLLLFENDGGLSWQQPLPGSNSDTGPEVPGYVILQDLDGDGQSEIVVLEETTVYAFTGDGEPLWQQPLTQSQASRINSGPLNSEAGKLTTCAVDTQNPSAILVTLSGQKAAYLLTADGRRLAEYQVGETIGALTCADLNSDGQGEVIVATETGVHVFGISPQVERTDLWTTPGLGRINTLSLADLDGDGRDEIVAGSQFERVFALTSDRRFLWNVPVGESPALALDTGDMDADGQAEVVVGNSQNGGELFLLDDNATAWTIPVGLWATSIAIRDETRQNFRNETQAQPEIIVGVNLLDNSKAVLLLNDEGQEIWRLKFDDVVSAVGSDGEYALVGTDAGRVYRLAAYGKLIGEYDLGAKVLSLEADLAASAGGKIYQLAGDAPTLIHDFGETLTAVQLGDTLVASFEGGRFSVVVGDEVVWDGTVDDEITSIASGDVNGDGEIEIAVGTESGHIYLFGLALNQPLLLLKPDLNETRDGYAYSVQVNDPEGDAVPVTLEIWDPSTGTWLPQPAQSLAEDQDRGRLNWDVTEPFDIWDSGQESRFRFVYDEGGRQRISPEITGPFNIPTTPWYVYYGQRLGLGALILLVPALGFVLYRRQRNYRQSPQGQAETLLKQLQAQPEQVLTRLHAIANHNPALLTALPPLARQAKQKAIAEVSERLNLLVVQSAVTSESVQNFIESVNRLKETSPDSKQGLLDNFSLFQQALEANTVNRIVILSPRLNELMTTAPAEMEAALAEMDQVIKTLNNFQRVQYIEDKTAYLAQALEALSHFEQEFQPEAQPPRLFQPERNILRSIAAHWRAVVNNALQDLHGRAQINVSLKTRRLLSLSDAALSLELTNNGRSPASNLNVTLVPDQPFAVSNGAVKLDILPAGRSETVTVPISAASSVEKFRAEFSITYDDREGESKVIAFADQVQVLKPAAEFQPIPNPYAPGTPLVPGSPIFFGRDDLFQFISENITGLTRQNILVLIGQRRMGKTSFLQQLPARLDDAYLPVYIDGQSLGIDPGMANFFYDLSLTIVDALADQDIDLDEPEPEDFEARPSTTFERTFLPAVFAAIGQRQLLLLFDEFEELEMRVASGKMEPTIFPFFRHLMQHSAQLGFIFVGTHRLESLSSDYWSIFFNIALYKHVAFLSEDAARALIMRPVAEYGLMYDDLALDKMLRVTAGHPYFLQLTCHALVNRANREARNYLTIQDVNNVLDEMVELGEAHFAFLWEQSSTRERLILAALSRLLDQEPAVTAAQVAELLTERGVAMVLPEVTGTLRQLVARDVVREIGGQPPRYEYKIELVRLWVERYKALGRVVEEVEL